MAPVTYTGINVPAACGRTALVSIVKFMKLSGGAIFDNYYFYIQPSNRRVTINQLIKQSLFFSVPRSAIVTLTLIRCESQLYSLLPNNCIKEKRKSGRKKNHKQTNNNVY